MAKCPYCAEEIQDEASKCKHCGEALCKKAPDRWYFKTPSLIIAFLCIGPFALPLLWFNPRFSRKTKIITTIIALILSYYLVAATIDALNSISKYYQQMFQALPRGF